MTHECDGLTTRKHWHGAGFVEAAVPMILNHVCLVCVCVFVFSGIPSVCKQVVSVETTRDIEWATYTCTLGFQVFGK